MPYHILSVDRSLPMLKMHRSEADDGQLFFLMRGDATRLGSVLHTRMLQSYPPGQPPNRAFVYVHVALTNWHPQLHHLAICDLDPPAVPGPVVTVPPVPFGIELHFRSVPFAPAYFAYNRIEP